MTSPNINKPESTNEKYDDVYSRGSSFGQDLSESSVRSLLTGRVKSPLSQFLQWGANLIGGAVNDIANILTGTGGASYEVLTGAAVERLGDIRTQITEAAKDFQNLADKAEELGTKQDGILEDVAKQNVVIEQAKGVADTAISNAESVSTALEKYQSANDKKVSSAVATAEGANKAITDLNKQFASKVDSQISSSATISDIKAKASTALSDSSKAIDWLESGVQVSNSALPLIPGTSTPTWTEGLTESTRDPDSTADADLPPNITKIYSSGWVDAKKEKGFTNPHKNLVTVDSRIEYEASWWMRATRGGKFAFVTLCDENGDGHIIEKLPATELDSNPSRYTWGYPIRAIITSPNGSGWTKFTTRFKFKEGVTKVRVYNLIFSNTNNDSGTTYFIADLQINPAIPSQADVDRAQNKAIQAHNLLWDKQEGWNATQERINKLNSAMWDKQGVVNTANVKAIKALSRIDIGNSLIEYMEPSDQDVANGTAKYDRPLWTKGMPYIKKGALSDDSRLPYYVNGYYRSAVDWEDTPVPGADLYRMFPESKPMPVLPNVIYKATAWVKSSSAQTRYFYITFCDEDGNPNIIELLPQDPDGSWPSSNTWGNPIHALIAEPPNTWTKVTTRFRFKEGVTQAKLYDICFSAKPGSAQEWVWMTDLQVAPDIPTQADVNKALFDSDKALLDLTKEIDERSKLNSRFDKEQRRTNKVVQAQLWNHQDMIEQLDIRASKTAGRKPKEGVSESVPYKNSKGYYTNGYRTDHPYFNIWVTNTGAIVAMRGSWVGQYEININWTNGAIDRWTVEVTDTKRVFEFTGGALHIDIRYVTSTVFPRSLCREARIIRDKIEDPEGLIRSVEYGNIRLKNSATCNKDVRYENFDGSMGWIKAGTVIPSGTELSTDGNSCVFKEVDDPGKGEYSVNSSMPPSGTTSIGYTT